MRLLITGCNGQLGRSLHDLSTEHPEHSYVWTDIDRLDLTDAQAVSRAVEEADVDMIVNCAAFTNVDGAEEHEAEALQANADAVANLARTGKPIVHISTDYVFSGEGWLPYRETDTPRPNTAYGRTKWEGEKRLMALSPDSLIIRTAWLYSPYGKNFVKTMLAAAEARDELRVVYDQIGSPTYALDLARLIFVVISAPRRPAGIYHFTNEGVCSWYDFTREIVRQARCLQGQDRYAARITPIRSEEYTYKTPRPHYSVLDKKKVKDTFGIDIPYWADSLNHCLRQLLSAGGC